MWLFIYYISNRQIDSKSLKEMNNKNEFLFDKILNNDNFSRYLYLDTVIVLLDGISCQKNLSDYHNELGNNLSINNLIKRIEEGKIGGFLKDFLDKYPINFNFFKDNQINLKVSFKEHSGIGVYINRDEIDTYGGGVAIEKKKC